MLNSSAQLFFFTWTHFAKQLNWQAKKTHLHVIETKELCLCDRHNKINFLKESFLHNNFYIPLVISLLEDILKWMASIIF